MAESGVRLVRIGGNGYEHSFPEPEELRAMVDAALSATHAGRLPRQTSVLVVFDGEGRALLQYVYGLDENLSDLLPRVTQF